MSHQSSSHQIYHSWKEESKCNKGDFINIIYNKMDNYSTYVFSLKYIARFDQLPINVIYIITYGYGDRAYVHYSTDLNYIMSLLTRLLWRLEEKCIHESGFFFFFLYFPIYSLFNAMIKKYLDAWKFRPLH